MDVALKDRVAAYLPEREGDLWVEYLHTCQECSDGNYDEVEPWAWRRLQRGLRMLPKEKPDEETR